MNDFGRFRFKAYEFDVTAKVARFHYTIDEALSFTESYHFDFDFVDYDPQLLDRALQSLFFMAGVSYFKTYIPNQIIVEAGQLDASGAAFFSKTYQKGLGEFWYVNGLDPQTSVNFPVTTDAIKPIDTESRNGLLIGVGGGKDSLVTIEALRNSGQAITTWSLGHKSQLQPLVQTIGLPHLWVERSWDQQLLDLNTRGALNGHVPISAIFACVGSVVAILSGKHDIVVSNEKAANEPTLVYQTVPINHQYSKSQEFEQDFQSHVQRTLGNAVRYYSFLRPLSELYIGELFASDNFNTYKSVFSSCNRAFRHDSDHMFWCGECPKCAFIFMILTPFIEQTDLEALWNGKNLLLDPSLRPVYQNLLGIAGEKPLDCVGEIEESRAAMRLCQQLYPELQSVYEFELPEDYDYKQLGSDEMPAEMRELLVKLLNQPAGQPSEQPE